MVKKLLVSILLVNIILSSIPLGSSANNQLWWGKEWSYTQEILVPIDTSAKNAKYQPIDVRVVFDHACWAKDESIHSIRVVYDNGGKQTEIESQIYDLEYSDDTHITLCSLVFLIPKDANGNERYYVYYDDTEKTGPNYPDHITIDESYYNYEPIPGYPYESRYYKITQNDEIVYAISQEGHSRGIGTSQQVTKLKEGATDVKPQNGEAIVSFEIWYYYGQDIKDYSSTLQKFISRKLLVDGNLMTEFEIVSGTPREDMQTTVTYKYYYCPSENKKIYAHVKHEMLKDCTVQSGENFDGVFVSIQTGGVKSSSIKELNFGKILPFLHVYTEQEIIQKYDIDTDPEYVPGEWHTRLLNTKHDVDLGSKAWACFDEGETGKAHSIILNSNSVIKSGKDERDGVQLKAHESDYPHLPGFEIDSATFSLGRNSYEKGSTHDIDIPKDLIIEFDAEFFSTENGGYKAVEREAEIFQSLSKIRPEVKEKNYDDEAEKGECSLTAYVHFAPSFPLGLLLSAALGKNIPYIYAELYKDDGSFISSGDINRLPSSKNIEFTSENMNFFQKLKTYIGFFDWRNLTFFKKICFNDLFPGKYLVKIYKGNSFWGKNQRFIGFQIINVEKDTKAHIFCKPEAKLQISVFDQEKKGVQDIRILLQRNKIDIASNVTDQKGTVTINVPCDIIDTYLLKAVHKGLVVYEEPIKIGYIRNLIPVKKTINIELYDFILEVADKWGLSPEVELNPVLINQDANEPVMITGEQISPGFFVFSDVFPGSYNLELTYKSFVYEKTIQIPAEKSFNLDFPVEYNVETSVFDVRGNSLDDVKIQICRGSKKIEKTVNGQSCSLFSIPPGRYNLSVYQNNELIGKRKITIYSDRSISLITNKETFYPLLITGVIGLFIAFCMFCSYRKKDFMFFIKIVCISLLFVALVFPWWMLHGSSGDVETTTRMFVIPVKMVTLTTTSDVIGGEFASLPNEMVNILGFIPVLTIISIILILSNLVFTRISKKRFSLLSLIAAITVLICSIGIFTYSMSELSEIGIGSFIGNGNQYVSIPGENIDATLFCSWGPNIGYCLYFFAIVSLIIILIINIAKWFKKKE